uniref:hypothetical protein n=1 Tax=Fluoribacter gormanii TaxID=464 RepID=UPI003D7AF8AA
KIRQQIVQLNRKSICIRNHTFTYYEACGSIIVAIEREKQIKGWSRKKKHDLINALNPERNDLSQSIL